VSTWCNYVVRKVISFTCSNALLILLTITYRKEYNLLQIILFKEYLHNDISGTIITATQLILLLPNPLVVNFCLAQYLWVCPCDRPSFLCIRVRLTRSISVLWMNGFLNNNSKLFSICLVFRFSRHLPLKLTALFKRKGMCTNTSDMKHKEVFYMCEKTQ